MSVLHIACELVRGPRRAVRANDRRAVIAVIQRYPFNVELPVNIELANRFDKTAAQLIAGSRVFVDSGTSRQRRLAPEGAGCLLNITYANWPPFDLVGVEQSRACPSLGFCRKLPGEIDCVANTG